MCTYFGANYFRVVFGAEANNASQRSLAAFEASGQGSPFQVVPFAVFFLLKVGINAFVSVDCSSRAHHCAVATSSLSSTGLWEASARLIRYS